MITKVITAQSWMPLMRLAMVVVANIPSRSNAAFTGTNFRPSFGYSLTSSSLEIGWKKENPEKNEGDKKSSPLDGLPELFGVSKKDGATRSSQKPNQATDGSDGQSSMFEFDGLPNLFGASKSDSTTSSKNVSPGSSSSYLSTLSTAASDSSSSQSPLLFTDKFEELVNSPRQIGQNIESGINGFTGEEEYKLGDISKTLIRKITDGGDYYRSELERASSTIIPKEPLFSPKEAASNFQRQYEEAASNVQRQYEGATSKVQRQYEELWKSSIEIDERIKSKVNKYTGDDSYQIGNITKAIIRKIASKEYDLSELTFLFRILVALGADLSLVTGFVPFKLLVKVLDLGLTLEVGEKIITAFSVEVDKRLNSDKNNINKTDEVAGSQQTLQSSPPSIELATGNSATMSAIADITGRKTYRVGDLAAAIGNDDDDEKEIDLSILKELEECLAMEKALLEKVSNIRRSGDAEKSNNDS